MSGLRIPGGLTISLTLVTFAVSACDLTGTLIKAQSDGAAEFTAAKGGEMADPELVFPLLGDGVVTNEGWMYYVPEYEPLLQAAIFSNVAYGQAWLGAQANAAEAAGNFEQVNKLNRRAGLMFARAKTITKKMMRLRDDGFDEALNGGLETFKVWVDENFFEQPDALPLLTAGLAYFVSILKSEEGLAASVDLPFARYMVERSVELDEKLMGAQGLAVLGQYWCTVPAMVGGNPQLGLELMNRAMKITERKAHSIMVPAASQCAVALQDRKLFHALLTEVIEAGDVPHWRLQNKLARHDAERLLKMMGELFYD